MIKGSNAISIVSATTQLPIMKKGSLSPRRWGVCLAGGLTVNRWNTHGKQTCDTQEGEIKWLHADSQTEGHAELSESGMEIESHPAASSVKRNVVQTLHESWWEQILVEQLSGWFIYLFIFIFKDRRSDTSKADKWPLPRGGSFWLDGS